MKKLAFSVVLLMVAGAGVSATAAGCSSSSSSGAAADTGTGGDTTVGDDSSSGSSGSSSGGDGSGSSSGSSSSSGGEGGSDAAACTTDASIPVLTPDGGMNTACEACIATSCPDSECKCINDTNTFTDDAGTYPGCDAFVNCVYADLYSILGMNPDAGAAAVQTAIQDCAGTDGGTYGAESAGLGETFITCVVGMCQSSCAP